MIQQYTTRITSVWMQTGTNLQHYMGKQHAMAQVQYLNTKRTSLQQTKDNLLLTLKDLYSFAKAKTKKVNSLWLDQSAVDKIKRG